jgi:hypothetical protein
MTDAAHLTIHIENKNPVELAELSLSFLSLARQYSKFVAKSDLPLSKEQGRLIIKEIKPGSIIADLYPYVLLSTGVVLNSPEAIDSIKSVLDFAKYLKSTFDALLNGKPLEPQVSAQDVRELANVLNATASDIGGSFQIKAEQGSTVQVTINYNSTEANAIQNRAYKEIELMKEPEQRPRKKVMMYWHTASTGTSGDKAVIEEITRKPLPVFIENEAEKQKMLKGKDNPFLVGFIVDVEILMVQDKIRGYKVTKLHEMLEDDPDLIKELA